MYPSETKFNEETMKLCVPLEDEEGCESVYEFPCKFVVCDRCGGKGKHVHPSIDQDGLTSKDFAEDPDFFFAYLDGVYDIQCQECNGKRVTPEICEEAADKEALKLLNSWQNAEAEYRQASSAERRNGA